LKDRITNPTIRINEKYQPEIDLPDRCQWMFTTNHDHSHAVNENDRRYTFFDVANTYVGDPDYFKGVWDQLKVNGGLGYRGFANYLHAWKTPEGVNINRSLRTEGHTDNVFRGMRDWEHFFTNLVLDSSLYPKSEGGMIYTSDLKDMFDAYCADHGIPQSKVEGYGQNGFMAKMLKKHLDAEAGGQGRVDRGPSKARTELKSLDNVRAWWRTPKPEGGRGFIISFDDEEE
jgi:hypothetical protein